MNNINLQEDSGINSPKTAINQPRYIDMRLACVEDGLENIGFRKFAAYIKTIHSETKIAYVPTGNWRGQRLRGQGHTLGRQAILLSPLRLGRLAL